MTSKRFAVYDNIKAGEIVCNQIGTYAFILGTSTTTDSLFLVDGYQITTDDWKKLQDLPHITATGTTESGGTFYTATGTTGTTNPKPGISVTPDGGITIYATGATFTNTGTGFTGSVIFNISTVNGTTSITGGSFIVNSTPGNYRSVLGSTTFSMYDQLNNQRRVNIDMDGTNHDTTLTLMDSSAMTMATIDSNSFSMYTPVGLGGAKIILDRTGIISVTGTANINGNTNITGGTVVINNSSGNYKSILGDTSISMYDGNNRKRVNIDMNGNNSDTTFTLLDKTGYTMAVFDNDRFTIHSTVGGVVALIDRAGTIYGNGNIISNTALKGGIGLEAGGIIKLGGNTSITGSINLSGTTNITGPVNITGALYLNGVQIVGSGGINPFNQSLDTSDSVRFNQVDIRPGGAGDAFIVRNSSVNAIIETDATISSATTYFRRTDGSEWTTLFHDSNILRLKNTSNNATIGLDSKNTSDGGYIGVGQSDGTTNIALNGYNGLLECLSLKINNNTIQTYASYYFAFPTYQFTIYSGVFVPLPQLGTYIPYNASAIVTTRGEISTDFSSSTIKIKSPTSGGKWQISLSADIKIETNDGSCEGDEFSIWAETTSASPLPYITLCTTTVPGPSRITSSSVYTYYHMFHVSSTHIFDSGTDTFVFTPRYGYSSVAPGYTSGISISAIEFKLSITKLIG